MPQNGVRFKPLTFYVDCDDFVGMWLFVCKLPIGTCSSNFELGRRSYDWMRFWLVKNAEVNCFYLLKTNAVVLKRRELWKNTITFYFGCSQIFLNRSVFHCFFSAAAVFNDGCAAANNNSWSLAKHRTQKCGRQDCQIVPKKLPSSLRALPGNFPKSP